MIKQNEFIDFLKNGKTLLGISLNQTVDSVYRLLGDPINVIGDKKIGFLEYQQGVRFGYFDDQVDEIGVKFFGNNNINIPVDISGEDLEIFTENTKNHDFIRVLNFAGIQWKSHDEKNLDVFCIKTIANVYVLFDLETGNITKATVSR